MPRDGRNKNMEMCTDHLIEAYSWAKMTEDLGLALELFILLSENEGVLTNESDLDDVVSWCASLFEESVDDFNRRVIKPLVRNGFLVVAGEVMHCPSILKRSKKMDAERVKKNKRNREYYERKKSQDVDVRTSENQTIGRPKKQVLTSEKTGSDVRKESDVRMLQKTTDGERKSHNSAVYSLSDSDVRTYPPRVREKRKKYPLYKIEETFFFFQGESEGEWQQSDIQLPTELQGNNAFAEAFNLYLEYRALHQKPIDAISIKNLINDYKSDPISAVAVLQGCIRSEGKYMQPMGLALFKTQQEKKGNGSSAIRTESAGDKRTNRVQPVYLT